MKFRIYIKLAIMLILLTFIEKAYSQTYSIGVGETLRLNVPSVSIGYVDKAIWACSNPAISFVSKATISAEITALKAFEGYATIELVYVEKYVDYKGFTRANTYTKNFYVSCKSSTSGGGSLSATSISVEPEIRVAIGEKAKIHYKLLPEGSTAEIQNSGYPGSYFNSLSLYQSDGYIEGWARAPGVEEVDVYFYNDKDEKVSAACNVTVYDPTWTEPQSVSLQEVLILTVGDSNKKILPLFTPSSAIALYGWSSDNPSIVYLSWKDCFVAKSVGIADMRLKTSNGLLAKCTVIVVAENWQAPQGIDKALNRVADMLKTTENENVK